MTSDLQKIMVADEGNAVAQRLDAQRHSEPTAEIFLKTGRTGAALGAVDHLRKSVGTSVDPGPALAAAAAVLGDADQPSSAGMAASRQGAGAQLRNAVAASRLPAQS